MHPACSLVSGSTKSGLQRQAHPRGIPSLARPLWAVVPGFPPPQSGTLEASLGSVRGLVVRRLRLGLAHPIQPRFQLLPCPHYLRPQLCCLTWASLLFLNPTLQLLATTPWTFLGPAPSWSALSHLKGTDIDHTHLCALSTFYMHVFSPTLHSLTITGFPSYQ